MRKLMAQNCQNSFLSLGSFKAHSEIELHTDHEIFAGLTVNLLKISVE